MHIEHATNDIDTLSATDFSLIKKNISTMPGLSYYQLLYCAQGGGTQLL